MAVAADPDLIRRAIDQAHLNVLRLALYQQTGDPELAAMRIESIQPAGTPFLAHVVAREHHAALKQKAVDYLSQTHDEHPIAPPRERALELMALFQGSEFEAAGASYGYEELGFEAFPREARWTVPPSDRGLEGFTVIIVGAGFGGIVAAIQLARLGIDFRIVERQKDIGGTWELNDYPEARVDITTFLYQYTFVKNYPWKSYFATRDELKEYVDHVVDEHGLRDRIETETSLSSAVWDADARRWMLELRLPDGRVEPACANVVISAAGLFSTPKMPDIPGIDDYQGRLVHTTGWDHDFALDGKHVALVGTGCTGLQLLPALARRAAQVTVYQRTPNWVTPMRGYHDKVSPETRWLFDTMPFYANWFNYSQYVAQLQSQKLHVVDPDWVAAGGLVNEANDQLRRGLTDYAHSKVGHRPDLIDRVVPAYAPLSRRLVVDNGCFDALLRPNVALVTDGIEAFTATGLRSRDGTERQADLVVMSAGFEVSRYLFPVDYVGRDGAKLADLWQRDGGRAYLSMMLPGFPNFFMLYGPNAGTRSGSFHSLMEMLMRYVATLIVAMREGGHDQIEVRRDAYDVYNARLDARMADMVWQRERSGGGYYVNEFGRAGVGMPWTLNEFDAMVRTPDLDAFSMG